MPIYNAFLNKISIEETKRYAGLKKTNFSNLEIEKACREVQVLSVPQGSWEIYDYSSCTAEIQTSPIISLKSEHLKKHLSFAQKLIFLAVTIGKDVETAVTHYFKAGKYSYSLLLDAAATTAVEQTADTIEKIIFAQYKTKGYHLLPRYSPGYGDWDIRFQPNMLTLASANKLGLTVTESCMLIPRKSITAVIGLVPNQVNLMTKNKSCRTCSQINCLARKESIL